MGHIILEELKSSSESVLVFEKPDTAGSPTKVTLRDLILVQKNDPYDFDYFNDIIEKLLLNINDIKCVHLSFKFLRDKYYIPFAEDKRALLPSTNRVRDQYCEVCGFVLNIYLLCRNAFKSIDKGCGVSLLSQNENNFKRSWTIIFEIEDYFLRIRTINEEKPIDVDFFKMAYNVTMILFNLLKRSDKKINVYHLERILNAVMTELNSYAVKNCDLPTFNLFFNDSSSLDDDDNKIKKLISTFFDKYFKIKDLNADRLYNTKDLNYFDVQYLYDNFIKNSKVFKLYGNIIRFYWKGKYRTIKNIYKDAIFFTVNARSLYALFDIYFKFFTAVVYYEVRVVLNIKKLEKKKEKLGMMKNKLNNFRSENFPLELQCLVTDINNLLALPNEKSNVNHSVDSDDVALANKLENTKRIIDDKFNKFNIVFEENSLFKMITQKGRLIKIFYSSDKALLIINNGIPNNQSPFYVYFLRLNR